MKSTAPNHKIAKVIIALSVPIILSLTYFIALSLPKLNNPAPTLTSISLTLTPTSTPQTYNVTVTSPIDYQLNAFQLNLTFDPQTTQITNISPGPIWEKATILAKTIDATTGNISFSAGREPQAQQTTNPILITITLSKDSTNTLKLLNTSQLALAGLNQSPPITINE